MKNLTSLLIVVLFTTSTIIAQKNIKGDGNIVTEKRNVGSFNQISVSGSFDVELIKGNEGAITLNGEKNILDELETEVIDGELKVKFKKGLNFRSYKKITLKIGFKNVNTLSLSGSGEIVSNAIIKGNQLNVNLSGSGEIKLKVDVSTLTSKISGSGNINLKGSSDNFNGAISGSGNINASELNSLIANAKISGSGNIKIHSEKEIHAKSSGSGNVIYSGNPAIVKAKSTGSGSIKKRN